MKESVERIVRQASDLIGEARDARTYVDRAALYALARIFSGDLERNAELFGGDAYLKEKGVEFLWHIGAVLGFDATNGHPADQHFGWALAAIENYGERCRVLAE